MKNESLGVRLSTGEITSKGWESRCAPFLACCASAPVAVVNVQVVLGSECLDPWLCFLPGRETRLVPLAKVGTDRQAWTAWASLESQCIDDQFNFRQSFELGAGSQASCNVKVGWLAVKRIGRLVVFARRSVSPFCGGAIPFCTIM